MKSLVIYATTSGNTQSIAEAIADALRRRGTVELMTADQAPASLPEADLAFIGGPTERHTLTEPMVRSSTAWRPGRSARRLRRPSTPACAGLACCLARRPMRSPSGFALRVFRSLRERKASSSA
jgi:hypothetical protein